MRGAADQLIDDARDAINFYSRASCEARRFNVFFIRIADNFYSRASGEARRFYKRPHQGGNGFLLTRLMRGAALMEV